MEIRVSTKFSLIHVEYVVASVLDGKKVETAFKPAVGHRVAMN